MNWIVERFKEPSSYAAAGGAVVGIGVLISQPIVIIVGIVGGALGFILKEKGVI
jgi:4-amino-4-deoxy-L-arabinose transferase-like glycosyltransferase|tara:strand:- start:404 stop:565 length:162 start_codon:yes stop_codon:yes gene_type:complete